MVTICPRCGEDVGIRVGLDDGETLTCTSCDAEYTVQDVRDLIACWGPLLVWLDAHPSKQTGK
jgi:uncharacterized protein (DUF983 family)